MATRIISRFAPWCAGLALALAFQAGSCALLAQQLELPQQPPIVHKVQGPSERLEITVNTSRILSLDQKIPQAQVNNPEILELHALSPTQVQVFGKTPGVTQVNLWGENQRIYSIDVIVYGDAQALTMLLRSQFPNSAITAVPVANGVLLSGFVDQPEHINRIIQIAEEFYPKVLNNMTVAGAQQVLLHVKVMEVSRTKLRTLGFDFAKATNGSLIVSGVSGLITSATSSAVTTSARANFSYSVLDGNNAFFGVLEALRQDNLMKVLAEPDLVTVSGRPATFQCGGEFPILVPQSLGTVSIEYKKFGTQVDFVPIVLGNGRIHLDVRPRVSEIDPTRSVTVNSTTVPGLRTREVETGVEMMAGQTLAIAGLVQSRDEAENRGFPWISELPYVGAAFRRVQHQYNEIELLVMVTPELVEAMPAQDVPPCGPGMRTTRPGDWDLYAKGHLEVPNCCPNGTVCPTGPDGMMPGPGPMVPMSAPTPAGVTPPVVPEPIEAPKPSTKKTPPAAPATETAARGDSDSAPQPPTLSASASPRRAENRSNPQNSYKTSEANKTATATSANRAGAEPSFFGPVGYEVK